MVDAAACVHVTWPCWHGHVDAMLESTHRPNVRVDAVHILNTSYVSSFGVLTEHAHIADIMV